MNRHEWSPFPIRWSGKVISSDWVIFLFVVTAMTRLVCWRNSKKMTSLLCSYRWKGCWHRTVPHREFFASPIFAVVIARQNRLAAFRVIFSWKQCAAPLFSCSRRTRIWVKWKFWRGSDYSPSTWSHCPAAYLFNQCRHRIFLPSALLTVLSSKRSALLSCSLISLFTRVPRCFRVGLSFLQKAVGVEHLHCSVGCLWDSCRGSEHDLRNSGRIVVGLGLATHMDCNH